MSLGMNWEKYYKLPLKFDEVTYAWDANGNMALMFDFDVKPEDSKEIVKIINGESNKSVEGIERDVINFTVEGKDLFCIRGWGNLTGVGANNLPEDKAAKIQDGFAEYVFNKLQNKK